MPRSFFPLRRAELEPQLKAGDSRIQQLFRGRSVSIDGRRPVVAVGQDQQLIYRLRAGWAARLRYLRDGRSQITGILLPGDLIAVRALFLEAQPDEIATLTDCEFDIVERAVLHDAALADPAVMLRLYWQTLEDERRLHNWLIALSRGRAEERMALLLLDVRGRLALAGLIPPDAAEIPWPLTQHELGEILGMTAVHVNRTLRALREQNLVYVKSRMARIDAAGLYQLAHPLLDIFERGRPEFGAPKLRATA